jgi:hypothetical protein
LSGRLGGASGRRRFGEERSAAPREAPDIIWVAQIGAVTPQAQSLPDPQYLRAPDAQPQNAAQLPRR